MVQALVDCTEPEKELLFVYAFLFPAVTGFAGIGWHFVYDSPRLAAWALVSIILPLTVWLPLETSPWLPRSLVGNVILWLGITFPGAASTL